MGFLVCILSHCSQHKHQRLNIYNGQNKTECCIFCQSPSQPIQMLEFESLEVCKQEHTIHITHLENIYLQSSKKRVETPGFFGGVLCVLSIPSPFVIFSAQQEKEIKINGMTMATQRQKETGRSRTRARFIRINVMRMYCFIPYMLLNAHIPHHTEYCVCMIYTHERRKYTLLAGSLAGANGLHFRYEQRENVQFRVFLLAFSLYSYNEPFVSARTANLQRPLSCKNSMYIIVCVCV